MEYLRNCTLESRVHHSELLTSVAMKTIAVHPACDALFDGFAPKVVQGTPVTRQAWH